MLKTVIPTPYPDGRVQTLNNMGAMSPAIDLITAEYLNFLNQSDSSIVALEIGTAYGAIALKALKTSSVNIIANDLDKGHLQVLEDNAKECCLDQVYRLKTEAGSFPQESTISSPKIDAILISRVAHFFSPTKLEEAINKFYQILNPSGCVYLLGITPYINRFASFIPEYEQRIKDGQAWPGYVNNLQLYANRDLTPDKVYTNLKDKEFHFLSSEILIKAFESKGFNISYAEEIPISYDSVQWSYDGRENVGIIACKHEDSFVGELDLKVESEL